MSNSSGWKSSHKGGKGNKGWRTNGNHKNSGDKADGNEQPSERPLDPNKAKQLLGQWFQKKGLKSADHCILEYEQTQQSQGKGRRKLVQHVCTVWIWPPDAEDWEVLKGEGQANRRLAEQLGYVQAVCSLGIKVPVQFQLSEKELAAQAAREQAAQQSQRRQDEEKDRVSAELINRMRQTITKALFGEVEHSSGGFYSPRETLEEAMPKPVPPFYYLPPLGEVRPGDLHTKGDSGGTSGQALRALVKKESQVFEGLQYFDDSRSTQHNAQMCLSACALMFEGSVAVIGMAIGPKKSVSRAVAARECLARISGPAPAGILPSKEEAGEHAQALNELKALQKLHPFKLWCVECICAGSNEGSWYRSSLRGRVPFTGRLREYKGEGCELAKTASIAAACGEAAMRLRRILGCEDSVGWLRQMSRVPMEIDDIPVEESQDALTRAAPCEDSLSLKAAYREFERRTIGRLQKGCEFTPVDVSNAPTVCSIQTYELPDEEKAVAERKKRGLPILPVKDLRPELAEILSENVVSVISGGTGSGKSTQIPQYLLEDFRPEAQDTEDHSQEQHSSSTSSKKPPPCRAGSMQPLHWTKPARILVTEPRRIAAISLAERVSAERGERVGETIGYTVRNDSHPPRASKAKGGTVEFCTVGIVLRRLQNDPTLRDVSHILIDEVHERDLMTDFLLILLKELLCRRSGDLRVMLMSATLDVATFTTYLWDCPAMEIPTGPRFPVQEIHLEDDFFKQQGFAKTASYLLQKEKEAREEAARERASELQDLEEAQAATGEEIDADDDADPGASRNTTGLWWGSAENDDTFITMIVEIIVHIAADLEKKGPLEDDETGIPGSVLCFLPGWAEIKAALELLEYTSVGNSLWIVPLHSTLPKEDQQKIFSRPPAGKTKVILGTNIAESAVTIDDVMVVVDAGLMREVSYDPVRRLSTLETVWVSQSSAIQRLGRAGRVRSGCCYRLYSREQFESVPWRTSPEMQRCELTQSCLQALALLRDPREFLALAPDPPTRTAVETSLQELAALGAIEANDEESNGASSHYGPREKMLPLGDVLSRMPVSPTLGRMMIYGGLFGCIDDACLLAAVVSAPRRAFVAPLGKRKDSLACQRGFNETSDILATFLAADYYEAWRYARGDSYANRCAGELFLVTKRLEQLLAARDSNREELLKAKLLFGRSDANSGWTDEAWEDRGAFSAGDNQEPASFVSTLEKPLSQEEQERLLHVNEGNLQLRLALLVASYPVNMALKRRPAMAKHNTKSGLEAIVSPQSVNAPPKAKAAQAAKDLEDGRRAPSWWSFGSMQISNTQGFLRDVTLIDPIHVALFGGLETHVERGKLREIDGWIELRGNPDVLRALAGLREKMKECVNLRALGACCDCSGVFPEAYRDVMSNIVDLLKAAGPRIEHLTELLPDHGPNSKYSVPPRPDVVIPRKSLSGRKGKGGKAGHDRGGKDRGKGWSEGKDRRSAWNGGKGRGKDRGWSEDQWTMEWSTETVDAWCTDQTWQEVDQSWLEVGGWQWSDTEGWWWS